MNKSTSLPSIKSNQKQSAIKKVGLSIINSNKKGPPSRKSNQDPEESLDDFPIYDERNSPALSISMEDTYKQGDVSIPMSSRSRKGASPGKTVVSNISGPRQRRGVNMSPALQQALVHVKDFMVIDLS